MDHWGVDDERETEAVEQTTVTLSNATSTMINIANTASSNGRRR